MIDKYTMDVPNFRSFDVWTVNLNLNVEDVEDGRRQERLIVGMINCNQPISWTEEQMLALEDAADKIGQLQYEIDANANVELHEKENTDGDGNTYKIVGKRFSSKPLDPLGPGMKLSDLGE